MDTFFAPKPVQVGNRDELCKALAEQMLRPDAVNYTVCYTDPHDEDGHSAANVQKHNAKQISMSIVRRVALKCPTYQWIRKTAQSTPHTIKNGFTCALAEQYLLPAGQRPHNTKSCNGSLVVTIIRRVPGQFMVSVTLGHDFAHEPCAIAAPAPTKAPTTVFHDAPAASLAPTQRIMHPLPARKNAQLAPEKEPTESLAKDVLRALGIRPRTPELVSRGSGGPVGSTTNKNRPSALPTNETKLPTVAEEAPKRGRGRPKKEVDPNAPPAKDPNAPKNPRGRPRKDALPIVPLALNNQTMTNDAFKPVLDVAASKNAGVVVPRFGPVPVVQV